MLHEFVLHVSVTKIVCIDRTCRRILFILFSDFGVFRICIKGHEIFRNFGINDIQVISGY